MSELKINNDGLLAQLEAAQGHAGEISPYTINGLFEDAFRELQRFRTENERLKDEACILQAANGAKAQALEIERAESKRLRSGVINETLNLVRSWLRREVCWSDQAVDMLLDYVRRALDESSP